jgi:cephalosporin hydroxylase
MQLFSKKYSLKGIEIGHHRMLYKGVPCLKCPFDYVIYQMIINEVKPDLIIEIGTNKGGSALYLADLLETIDHGIIHTIDIDDRANILAKNHSRIKFFHEGWENYNLENTINYKRILVIEDGSHEFESTLGAIIKFSPLVSKGSYLIVEDGILDDLGMKKQYQGGPNRAIKLFLKENKDFCIDEKWINFFGKNATFNTNGYLLKTI